MIVRRSASLALAALMLQLTVARADVACAAHSSLSRSAEAAPQQGSGGHHSDHGAPADTKQKCDTPSQPQCCQVLVSCSVVLDVGVRIQGACTTLPRVTVAVALADLPPSRVAAPDPPPPKA